MSRKPLIAGNWKMNNTYGEAVVLAQEISNNIYRDWADQVDILVCTPSIDLKPVYSVFQFDKSPVAVGAQNVYWEQKGAYTGEISVPMIKEVGCACSIVGHSERRGYFGETNEDVNKKIKALLAGGLYAVVCVGESLRVRDTGDEAAIEYVCAQVKAAFAGLEASEVSNCVVAYEPIWAIGTGRTATPEQAQAVCAAIRAELASEFGQDCAEGMRVLYGGSMNVGNVDALLGQPDIDGGLIGGASLKSGDFVSLIKSALQSA